MRRPPDEDDQRTPWTAAPSRRGKSHRLRASSQALELVLANDSYIPKAGLGQRRRNRLLHLAAFQNPEFYKAQAMRLPTYDKPRIIGCAEDHPHHVGLPRGCLDDVVSDLERPWRPRIRDERRDGEPLHVTFHGELRREQQQAAAAPRRHQTGVLDGKRDVRVYDSADLNVSMLARMFDRRCRGD